MFLSLLARVKSVLIKNVIVKTQYSSRAPASTYLRSVLVVASHPSLTDCYGPSFSGDASTGLFLPIGKTIFLLS